MVNCRITRSTWRSVPAGPLLAPETGEVHVPEEGPGVNSGGGVRVCHVPKYALAVAPCQAPSDSFFCSFTLAQRASAA